MSTDLQDRLGEVATTATTGIELRRPDIEARPVGAKRRALVLVLAIFLAVVAGASWFATRGRDELRTVDGAPTTATWPDPTRVAMQPADLPRIVLTAEGFTATGAAEQRSRVSTATSADPMAAYRPLYTQVFRRVDEPWSIIQVSTFGDLDLRESGRCSASPLGADPVTSVCNFSGDSTQFEVGSDGVVVRVQGLNVSAADVRRFVDELGGEAVFAPPPVCCGPAPSGFEAIGGGPTNAPSDVASLNYAGPRGERVDLGMVSGSSLLAYDDLLFFAADFPDGEVSIHEVGDRVVAMLGSLDSRDAFWMEGDDVVATLHAEGLSADETVDLLRSIDVDPTVWDRLLAGG